MGYTMRQTESIFLMKAEYCLPALHAAQDLMTNPKYDSIKSGGSFSKTAKNSQKWFSWMNLATPENWTHVKDAFDAWRYTADVDDEGNICDVFFEGEKIGQEIEFFKVIAPYVEPGSYIQMIGEDGFIWRWVFDNDTVEEKAAEVTFK